MANPYHILEIHQECNPQELRQAYKQALLKHHPDKTQLTQQKPKYTIDDINKAYKSILNADPHAPVKFHSKIEFSEIVDLSEFEELEIDNEFQFIRKCRCGCDGYKLTESDLEANEDATEIAVQCSICSLWILVQYEVAYDE